MEDRRAEREPEGGATQRRRGAGSSPRPRPEVRWSGPRGRPPGAAAARPLRHPRGSDELERRLAVWVVRPRLQALDHGLERGAQENDVVEPRMEPPRFSSQPATKRTSASSVARSSSIASSCQRWRPSADLAEAVIRVDRLVAASSELADDARLPGPRHAREQIPLHARSPPASSTIVTGPSFTSSTCIRAPKTPCSTASPSARRRRRSARTAAAPCPARPRRRSSAGCPWSCPRSA